MWQTGRKAARARVGDASISVSASVPPRRDALPPLEPATHPLAERARSFGVLAGRGARWLLLGLALAAVAWLLFQRGQPDIFAIPGSVAFWTPIAAGLAALALVLHLRRQNSNVTHRLFAVRQGRGDPFARLAAEARAARPPRR